MTPLDKFKRKLLKNHITNRKKIIMYCDEAIDEVNKEWLDGMSEAINKPFRSNK